MNPILYIVLNKELRMSAGKAAAQAVHAAMMLGKTHSEVFTAYTKRTVIVLEAENSEQIKNLQQYLKNADIYSVYYIDEGTNEISPYSVTALAVEPFDMDDEKREIFEELNLFRGVYAEDTTTRSNKAADAIMRAVHYDYDRPWFVRKTIKWLRKQK